MPLRCAQTPLAIARQVRNLNGVADLGRAAQAQAEWPGAEFDDNLASPAMAERRLQAQIDELKKSADEMAVVGKWATARNIPPRTAVIWPCEELVQHCREQTRSHGQLPGFN